MKIEIEISEEDYKRIESTVMTIEEMHETLDGRLYRAVVNGVIGSALKKDLRG